MPIRKLLELCVKGDDHQVRLILLEKPDLINAAYEHGDMFYVGDKYLRKGSTPIIAAAVGGNVGVISTLLAYSADVHKTNSLGRNAVMKAAFHGHLPATIILLDAAPDLLDKVDDALWTPLHWAAFNGKWEVCLFLIVRGSDLLAHDTVGRSALDYFSDYVDKENFPTASDRQMRIDALRSAFAAGPHPSQVLRRKDDAWIRRRPFLCVMAGCGFQPLLSKRLDAIRLSPRLEYDADIPPVELKTPDQRRAHLQMQVFGHVAFWKMVASYL